MSIRTAYETFSNEKMKIIACDQNKLKVLNCDQKKEVLKKSKKKYVNEDEDS